MTGSVQIYEDRLMVVTAPEDSLAKIRAAAPKSWDIP